MSKFSYDSEGGDRIGVILVHGYIHSDLHLQVEAVIGEDWYSKEYYCEGGYMITLATTQEIDIHTANDYICEIYNHEDDIPDMNPDNREEPIFVGIQDTPCILLNDDGEYICDFLGGIWGYEQGSYDRYQE